jgi:hypothetical protein
LAALAAGATACLALKVPGNIIGPIVVASSNLACLGMLVLLLREKGAGTEPPVAPVVSQEGQGG